MTHKSVVLVNKIMKIVILTEYHPNEISGLGIRRVIADQIGAHIDDIDSWHFIDTKEASE